MRLLVTGGRRYSDVKCVTALLDRALAAHRLTLQRMERSGVVTGEPLIIVHGAATGADTLAHRWALWRAAEGLPVLAEPHPADWERGRGAGVARNAGMVSTLRPGDCCLSFPGGRGTADCTARAVACGVWVGAPVREAPGAPWDVRWWHRDGRSRGPAYDGRAQRAA